MNEQRVRLIFRSVSEIVGSKGLGAMGGRRMGILVLTDSAELRQVAMPCSLRLARELNARISEGHTTRDMVPEALWNVIQWQTDLRLEVHIDRIREGRYQAVLRNADTLEEVPISAAEGVLLSFVTRGDIPVMMAENLFLRQSTVFDPNAEGVSLPVNTITDEMLQQALDRAVEAENYEMASQLHEEQERRRKRKDKKESTENQEQGADSEAL